LTDFHGLMVGTPLVFAFTPGRNAPQLREDLADRAWNDGDLLNLICAAEFGSYDTWLDQWIEQEANSTARARRVRGIAARGWRGLGRDLEALEQREATNGYERFFSEIAVARARRRMEARSLMRDVEQAATDSEAWLAYRALIHRMDRRIYVEAWRREWPQALSRRRALAHELALADSERLFRRTEGDLGRAFGGVVYPTQIPPWAPIEMYRD
jgi:hypothetical protein